MAVQLIQTCSPICHLIVTTMAELRVPVDSPVLANQEGVWFLIPPSPKTSCSNTIHHHVAHNSNWDHHAAHNSNWEFLDAIALCSLRWLVGSAWHMYLLYDMKPCLGWLPSWHSQSRYAIPDANHSQRQTLSFVSAMCSLSGRMASDYSELEIFGNTD